MSREMATYSAARVARRAGEGLILVGRNVLVHPEEIVRIVFALDRLQPRVGLRAKCIAYEIFTFAVAGEVEIESAGRVALHIRQKPRTQLMFSASSAGFDQTPSMLNM